MKYRAQLGSNITDAGTTDARVTDDHGAWPPPDASARVQLESVPEAAPAERRLPNAAELIIAAGLVAVLLSVASLFVDSLSLPPFSTVLLTALGATLVFVGVQKRRSRHAVQRAAGVTVAAEPLPAIDLPSLTGQIGGVLGQLRRSYGMAYRTRTWIEEMLPAYGAEFDDPTLARDLLGVAALDAGGIRADVTRLAETYTREQIVATGAAVLSALQNVLAACDVPTELLPTPHPSDPSAWPASRC